MSQRFSIDANNITAGGRPTARVDLSGSGVWGPTPKGSRRIPPAISSEQAYFWSASWQREEAESLRERDAGSFQTFDSEDPNDVVRWLLS